jgi:L,D-peptidoglycan transpeptidase YkuD (ErfK/YbiS/YcfS/YnhG family)
MVRDFIFDPVLENAPGLTAIRFMRNLPSGKYNITAICSMRRRNCDLREKRATRRDADVLTVRPRPGNPTQGLLNWGGLVLACALGRGGIASLKREGDGATPLGAMRLLHGYFRKGRLSAPGRSRLALTPIGPDDGWCDAPGDRNYNRPVCLPHPASCERMMRDDRLYDCCIVLDYNIAPCRRGRGSAIFLHIAKQGYRPTEGCVAVDPRTMMRLLPHLSPRTVMRVLR